MIVGKAIYHLLTNATAITDIVGTRIYPEVAQQDGDLPYIVYNITNNEPSDTKPEPSKLDTAGVEVNCYATSYSQAIDIAVAVRGALDRVKGTYNGVNVQSIQYVNEIIDFDEPQRAYNISADYEVRISRTDFEIAQGSPITGVELGELSDVNVTGVTDNQILSYDAATDTWVPAADAGGAENIDDLDDVNAGSPNNNDVLKFNSSTSKWTPVDWLSVLYAQLKQGSDATITNGSLTDSSLELTSTQAKLKVGITGLDITETSPGTIEIIVATDATGSTEFTALTLEGLTTSEKARFTVNNGTSFYIHGTSAYNNQLRGNSGITSSKVNMLPASDGLLALDADIPSTTDDLTEGSTNIYYTEARVSANTDVAANTAKVGVIAGGTTGQALVKTSGADYDVEWADIAVDVQYHQRYDTEAAALRSGATETVELYYTAQADGDGLSESASSDTPTSGYDIRRKLWYAEKAQADPDTSADWTQFTAIADNTTFNNAKAALLAYLKERTGGTVPISLKMTWEEVSQTAYLLDQSYGSGAEAAYSTRQLRNAATDCMVIRRASDSTTTTIGFDGSGNIDESAIETFCTGTTCTVVTWKDQSGNGNDATAAASGNEPTIYTGGALVKENGKVAVQFIDDFMTSAQSSTITAITAFVTGSVTNRNDPSNRILSFTYSSGRDFDSNRLIPLFASATNEIASYDDGLKRSAFSYTFQTPSLFTHITDASNITNYLNGSQAASTALPSALSQSITGYSIGRGSTTGTSNMILREIIAYEADRSANRTQIESNIGDYFTQNTPLLDTYSGAAAAYSLRLLDSTYTGALINVWNGTSYADIYPNVFGELDTVALAAHCGSNDGFIRYWYDQSGNSNTAAQTTTANMPKIYDGTTGVLTVNGKPTIQDNNDAGVKSLTTSISSDSLHTSNEFTCIGVFQGDSNGRLYFGTSSSAFPSWAPRRFAYDLAYTPTQKTGGTSLIDTQTIGFLNRSGNNVASYLNNTAAISSTDTANITTATVTDFPIAQMRYGTFVQEYVIWNSDKLTDRTEIQDNLNNFYSAY